MQLPAKYHKWMFEFEMRHPLFLAAERKFWRLWKILRYPRSNYLDWLKWHQRPSIGDKVEDCRGKIVTVIRIDADKDTLHFDDGTSASWMNCCDSVQN